MAMVQDRTDPITHEEQVNSVPGGTHIDQVSVETAIPKKILGAWTRRYSFLSSGRDEAGDCVYNARDIHKLRTLKLLVDNGYRLGAIAHKRLSELEMLLRNLAPQTSTASQPEQLQPLLKYLKTHDPSGMRRALRVGLKDAGLEQFVLNTVAPLSAMIGELWAIGEIEIFEERLVTEVVQTILNEALGGYSHSFGSPTIVLATLPFEKHQLGLLMAQALFAVSGARCVYLGAQVPMDDLLRVASIQRTDIIAISMAASYSAKDAQQAMDDIDASLPDAVEVWLGGTGAQGLHRLPRRVSVFTSLTDIRRSLQSWRATHRLRLHRPHLH